MRVNQIAIYVAGAAGIITSSMRDAPRGLEHRMYRAIIDSAWFQNLGDYPSEATEDNLRDIGITFVKVQAEVTAFYSREAIKQLKEDDADPMQILSDAYYGITRHSAGAAEMVRLLPKQIRDRLPIPGHRLSMSEKGRTVIDSIDETAVRKAIDQLEKLIEICEEVMYEH